MKSYLGLVQKILDEGSMKFNRTGVNALTISGLEFQHEMSEGFPLLTTKKMANKTIRVELEGFIKGITDKKWFQERGCKIWDEWCNPEKVPYGKDLETRKKMLKEEDLGPIYGFQWRNFGANYSGQHSNYVGKGIDQLERVVNTLETNPEDRRMIVSSWNPNDLKKMALPPCHYSWQVNVVDEKLNLIWNQRSVDTMLGLPFNIASYGVLLHLLAKESGFEEGKLIGHLGDVHIYENHLKGAEIQLKREPFNLPKIETENFSNIFDWEHNQTKFVNYKSHGKMGKKIFPIAI